jgi:spermidine/putrescine transport system ATP-binding protein
VLLLDEPLGALDLKLREAMQDELKSLQRRLGITFVFVTHDQEEALTMSDRIGVMSQGKLQQVGTPREIYTTPVNRFVASFIGETNFLPGATVPGGVRIGSGAVIEAATSRAGNVTVAIRPEQVRIVPADDPGAIPATVANLVYFGTDTHFHLALSDGTEVVARLQSGTDETHLTPGSAVGLRLAPGAAQVLED